jgi:hypothetical protein
MRHAGRARFQAAKRRQSAATRPIPVGRGGLRTPGNRAGTDFVRSVQGMFRARQTPAFGAPLANHPSPRQPNS